MEIYILTFREEYLTSPRILVAYNSGEESGLAFADLNKQYGELKKKYAKNNDINNLWKEELKKRKIPEENIFLFDNNYLYNYSFEVFEVCLV